MPIVAKLDELGKPAWIALMVLGFSCSGRSASRSSPSSSGVDAWAAGKVVTMSRWHHGAGMSGMRSAGTWWQPPQRSSGNRAFDEYRTETLRRLEDEQREFHDFLDRLRMAKDKSEFDQFMAERRNRRPEPRTRNLLRRRIEYSVSASSRPPCSPTRRAVLLSPSTPPLRPTKRASQPPPRFSARSSRPVPQPGSPQHPLVTQH